ncbi:MAG: hypothetical protein WAQ24_02525 [Candidatus Saccharimonadales bacterium]
MRVLRTIIFILVCLGLIWLVIVLFSKVFTGGNNTAAPVKTSSLTKYANANTTAHMYIDGPVTLNQEHYALKISVNSSQSQIEYINGYDGSVIRQEVFPNTIEAYTAFLKALNVAKFSHGNDDSALADEQGQCPLQNRFIYSLKDNGKDVFRYWSTSCGGGTFLGSKDTVRTLFIRQVPGKTFNDFTRNFSLR